MSNTIGHYISFDVFVGCHIIYIINKWTEKTTITAILKITNTTPIMSVD